MKGSSGSRERARPRLPCGPSAGLWLKRMVWEFDVTRSSFWFQHRPLGNHRFNPSTWFPYQEIKDSTNHPPYSAQVDVDGWTVC